MKLILILAILIPYITAGAVNAANVVMIKEAADTSTSNAKYTIIQDNITYRFNHMVNTTTKENIYRIFDARTGKIILTKPGNWECAFSLVNSSLVGGLHGNQNYSALSFYKDGVKFIPAITSPKTIAKDITIVEKSNLYDPTNNQRICILTQIYDFNGLTLKIHNVYNWTVNSYVQTFYAAMLPANPVIYTNAILSGGKYENLSKTLNQDLYRYDSASGKFWSNNGLYMNLTVLNPSISLNNYLFNGKTKTYIKQNGFYNKLYITRVSYPDPEQINMGDIWDIKSEYVIWNENETLWNNNSIENYPEEENIIGMQDTGTPFTGIILALLLLIGGFYINRRSL